MTLFGVVGDLIWVALLLEALPAFRAMWTGGEGLARVERLWRRVWPYSEEALQGWLRAQAAVYLGGWFLTFAYLAGVLSHSAEGSTRLVLVLVLRIGFIGFAGAIAMAISIVLFNVPKRLALPSLREQDGLVRSWRLRRRRVHKR
jgi:hypothetical protein